MAGLHQTLEPELTVEQRIDLEHRIEIVQSQAVDLALLKGSIEKEKAVILKTLVDAGIDKLEIGGIPVAVIGGDSSKLDKLLFVQLGGSLDMLERATKKNPKKKHVRIGTEKEE